MIVLAGLAGAGKTEFLGELERAGEQVLDLEALARHRGSAFGAIGAPGPQPSHAAFARSVEERVRASDRRRALWVEDEGPFIGSVGVPTWLSAAIVRAPVVEVEAPFAARVDRLTKAYTGAPHGQLLAALRRCRRRLGADRADQAAALLRADDLRGAIAVVLPWFDAAYRWRTASYGSRTVLATALARDEERIG